MPCLKEEIKQSILSSALVNFREQGYTGASMRVIAKNAGISLGNVYHYFENKNDLFNALVEPVYRSYITFINDIDKLLKFGDGSEEGIDSNSNISEVNRIKEKLLEICEDHYIELLILMDKSSSTKYEDAKQVLIMLLDKILTKKFLPYMKDSGIYSRDITYIYSASFIESICIILRKYDGGVQIRLLIDHLIKMFFEELEKRI